MHLSPKTRSFFPLPSLGFLHTNRLAGTLQMLRKTFWRLQRCCKCFEKLFGVCRNAANASKNFSAFAGVPQVPRKTFWRLREPRKCLKKLFGVCGSPASVSKNFLVFAGAPQVSRKTFWCLRESRKCPEKLFGYRVTSVEASLLILCLYRTHIKSKKHAELGLFCFFCVDRKQMV